MHSKSRFQNLVFGPSFSPTSAALAIMLTLLFLILLLVLMNVTALPAQAQTFKVIHTFTGGGDGSRPENGLTMDAAGNLYGTTCGGGASGAGIVFKLKHSGSGWMLTPIYTFAGGTDGSCPSGRVALAHDGTLYGTTNGGGGSGCSGSGCGTVFHLAPSPTAPKTALAPWKETVLYRFTGGSDGGNPQGDLLLDQSGNIYGTTQYGGTGGCSQYYIPGCGVVYELTPSGGGWTEKVVYEFQGGNDGAWPSGGVIFDKAGNLYGVCHLGGPGGSGTVYELSPAGSGWAGQTLYSWSSSPDWTDGQPIGGLLMDASGNLYGTTPYYGSPPPCCGTAWQLSLIQGFWSYNTLYRWGSGGSTGGPLDKLSMDAAGNLYGTTERNGANYAGNVFKLSTSGGGYTSLYDFTGGNDGGGARSIIVMDANGNLYGTTAYGGSSGNGVVWEITP